MTEQPPSQPPPGGSFPPPPVNNPPPYGGYPPPAYGGYPAPPGAYPPPAPRGFVWLPGRGSVAVATFGQRFLARLIDTLIESALFAIVVVLGVVLTNVSAHTEIDQNGQPGPVASNWSVAALFLGIGIASIVTMLYEWLMVVYKGATWGKMAMGIRVVNQPTGQNLDYGPAFLRWLIPVVASLACSLLTLLVYVSPLFDNSGRLQGWHDKVANDVVIKVR